MLLKVFPQFLVAFTICSRVVWIRPITSLHVSNSLASLPAIKMNSPPQLFNCLFSSHFSCPASYNEDVFNSSFNKICFRFSCSEGCYFSWVHISANIFQHAKTIQFTIYGFLCSFSCLFITIFVASPLIFSSTRVPEVARLGILFQDLGNVWNL